MIEKRDTFMKMYYDLIKYKTIRESFEEFIHDCLPNPHEKPNFFIIEFEDEFQDIDAIGVNGYKPWRKRGWVHVDG